MRTKRRRPARVWVWPSLPLSLFAAIAIVLVVIANTVNAKANANANPNPNPNAANAGASATPNNLNFNSNLEFNLKRRMLSASEFVEKLRADLRKKKLNGAVGAGVGIDNGNPNPNSNPNPNPNANPKLASFLKRLHDRDAKKAYGHALKKRAVARDGSRPHQNKENAQQRSPEGG